MNADELCEHLASFAESYDGVCACPAHRARFEELLLPYRPQNGWDWRPFSLAKKQGMSTCGLFGEACADQAGLDVPWHGKLYVFGTAVSRLRIWAMAHGCWQQWQDGLEPVRGDVIIIGEGMATHEMVCTGWSGGGTDESQILSVDGGQVCTLLHGNGHDGTGRQAIRRCARSWEVRASGAFIGDRKVIGWLVTALAPVRD